MTIRTWCRTVAATLALALSVVTFAQERGVPVTGMTGIQETTAEIMLRQKLMPQYEPGQPFIMKKEEDGLDRSRLKSAPGAPAVSQWPPLSANSAQNRGGGAYAPQTPGVGFNAITLAESGFIPPDSTGDVGLTDIFVAANGRFKTFSKTGAAGSLNVTADTFFNSVRNGSGISDPRVRYDRLADRWIVAGINTGGVNNRIVLAVSNSGTITAGTVWTFFFFQCNTGGTADDNNAFADYPTMGVDNNAIYIGCNMFKGNPLSFWGATAWVVRKSSVLGAGPIVFTPFRQICTQTGVGIYTPLGVDNWNASATEGYFIGVDGIAFSQLVMRRITNPGGTPTISGNINLTVPTTTSPSTVPALGSTVPLSAVDDRLFDAQICHNKITGARTLWTGHHFRMNSTGVASTTGGRHGSRWYEIGNLSGTPSLIQSGSLFDPAASSIKNYWFPGITVTGQGHMAMGVSYAGTANQAGVAAAGRLRTDALGTTRAPDLVQASSSSYNVQGGSEQRWGDYSRTAVDPADDMTCWTFQEWCNATNSWAVRVVQLRAPAPAAPSSVSASVTQGQSNVNVTVTGTSTNGTEFFDPGAGYPNRIAASVSGTGVTVNSITFNTPTTVTLNLTVAANATTGTRNVTITNPDGQSATGNNILTVNASSGPPTITTLSPSSATAGGSAFTLTVNGTNFTGASVVRWNGSNRTTTFVNSGQLTASISAADIANGAVVPVTVQDGANTSNSVNFTVNNPVPTLVSMSPTTRQAAGGTFTLTVNGTGFVPGSIVRWNGNNRTTTFVSGTQLTASIPAGDTAFVGNSTVTVFNPAPAGGTTGGLTFSVTPIELAPNTLTVLFGSQAVGSVANLAQSDDSKYRINYDRFATRNDPKIRLEIGHTSPSTTASRIDWSVESSLTGMGTTQRIEILNPTTNVWTTLNTSILTSTDTVRSGSITTGASSFVSAGGVVKLRVSCTQTGVGPQLTTSLSIDYVHLTIWP